MEFIDTHTHMNDPRFESDFEELMRRQQIVGVTRMIVPGVEKVEQESVVSLAKKYPENFFALAGVHPTVVNDNKEYQSELVALREILKESPVKFYGIGEIGLDLHWSKDFLKEQIEILHAQLELAIEYDLPVIFHVREAWEQMMPIIEQYAGRIRGVFHSFSGDVEIYNKLKGLGDFSFGISGPVTYRKSTVAEAVRGMSLTDIVLETDAPYLPPEPYRGKRNESTYLVEIARKIGDLQGVDIAEVARVTTANAERIFGLPVRCCSDD